MNTFLETFARVWIIGGFLLLPFNSAVLSFLICIRFNLDFDFWMGIAKRVWVLQIAWNLVFFSLSLFLGDSEKAEKAASTTYTLTRGKPENWGAGEGKYAIEKFNPDVWDFHFYRDNKEIPIDSKEATPFQKAYEETGIEKGLDPEGLPDVIYSDGSVLRVKEADLVGKITAFNALSENGARAYIDRYNKGYDKDTNPIQDVLLILLLSAVCPFLYTFVEALILGAILVVVDNPLLGAAIFGPHIFRLWRIGAFKV